LKKILFISLAVVLALSMGLIGCEPTEGPGELTPVPYENDGYFIQETIGEVESLDPAWGYDTASGENVQYMYETLINFDGEATDEFVPVLATSVPTYNSANHTFTFTIRSGVQFHNGDTLTAEDVEYTFERAMVQDRPGGPIWMFFSPLLGVSGYDDTTFSAIDAAVESSGDQVTFTLIGDYWELAFLQILCGPWAGIVDKSWCIAEGDWNGTEGDAPNFNHPQNPSDTALFTDCNGTGPWKFNLWDAGTQLKYEKNDNYWQGSVPFDWVIYSIVEEWSTRKLDLQNGEADLVYVPRMYIHELDDYDLNTYQDLPELTVDAFFFNMDIASNSTFIGSGALDGNGIPTDFFTDIDVRKGCCYAFDWDTYIADALLGEAEQRGSPVIEGLPFYDDTTSMYELDLDASTTHFQAAYNGTLWSTGFKFTLLYNAGNLPRKTACEILAENLADVNPLFQVSIQPLAWPTILGKIFGGRDMPMFQIGWLPDYPHADNFVVPFMASYGVFAYFQGYGYPALDTLIEDAFMETDPTTQQTMYSEIQETYYDDAPGICLVQPLGRRFFTPYISGFYFNPVFPGAPGNLYALSKSES
jgi:peptide/nickel transport system substrate-binding protein